MNIFEAVKQSVTTRQAAEYYGIRVNRNGMAVCPFLRDKNPSMKVDKRFHCFACQADGDAVDFVSRLPGRWTPRRSIAVSKSSPRKSPKNCWKQESTARRVTQPARVAAGPWCSIPNSPSVRIPIRGGSPHFPKSPWWHRPLWRGRGQSGL